LRTRYSELLRYVGAPIRYIHVGKTGGTAVKSVLSQISRRTLRYQFLSSGHEFKFGNLGERERYFFSLREPLSRFRAGFYSRLRKGQPRLYNEWSSDEEAAFQRFPHANDLGEALSSRDPLIKRAAVRAMNSIRHVSEPLIDFFPDFEEVLRHPPIIILRQEYLYSDLKMLLRRLRLDHLLPEAIDPTAKHANDYRSTPGLSELAVRNLREHYARDIHLYSRLDALASELRGQ
jgi:hypothetical protein